MTYNANDNLYYMTSAEYAADTTIKARPTAKVYVYETGKIHRNREAILRSMQKWD